MHVFGIGTDIVSVSDFRTRMNNNPALIKHVFTFREIDWCEAYFDPAERFSGRFAAKEAFYKSLPPEIQNEIDWLDIEITPGQNGRPEVHPSLKCANLLENKGIGDMFLTLSHERGLAVAFVVLTGRNGPGIGE